jgi:hypothetical protein
MKQWQHTTSTEVAVFAGISVAEERQQHITFVSPKHSDLCLMYKLLSSFVAVRKSHKKCRLATELRLKAHRMSRPNLCLKSVTCLKRKGSRRPQPRCELLDDLLSGIINTIFCSGIEKRVHSSLVLISTSLQQLWFCWKITGGVYYVRVNFLTANNIKTKKEKRDWF